MPGPLEASASLFENGYRWYRAAWGRYSQADPLGVRGDPNPYQYAQSKPTMYLDPLGLKCNEWSSPKDWRDVFPDSTPGRWIDVTDILTSPVPGGGRARPAIDTFIKWLGGKVETPKVCSRTVGKKLAIQWGLRVTRTCDCILRADDPEPPPEYIYYDSQPVLDSSGCCKGVVETAVRRGAIDFKPLGDPKQEYKTTFGSCEDLP
jgi:RHS repeat-associated protein